MMPRVQRSHYAALVAALAVVVGGGSLLASALHRRSADSGMNRASATIDNPSWMGSSASATPLAAPSSTGTSAQGLARAQRAKQIQRLNAALARVDAAAPDFSVAVFDRITGQKYAYHGTSSYDTASIVKAQILACLLLHDQDAGHGPTSSEMALATPMIRYSDNNAATDLFEHVGGSSAVGQCNRRLGLTHTAVSSAWGLTRTTANDQTRLLSEFVDPAGPLNAGSRRTILRLMSSVDDSQDWGIPSIAEPDETATVKNGWDTRSTDGGLWVINTIGRITSDDGDVNVSVAVLSHDNKSMGAGVALVEKVAKLTRQYLDY
jgi:hypothetical protein